MTVSADMQITNPKDLTQTPLASGGSNNSPADGATKVSIIICTRNRAGHLKQTLESVGKVEIPRSLTCELVVASDGSNDQTTEIVNRHGVKNMPVTWLDLPAQGKSQALNIAIRRCQGEIILLTDDDVRVPKNWVSAMCEPILDGVTDAVAGGVRIAPSLERPWMTDRHHGWLASTKAWPKEGEVNFVGANMAFTRRAFETIGGFDTNIGPGGIGNAEDTFFGYQLKFNGFLAVRNLDCVVEHHFDERRLQRAFWLISARNRGKSNAYVSICRKGETPTLYNVVFSLLNVVLRLNILRVLRLPDSLKKEGCPDWEMVLVRKQHALFWSLIFRIRGMRLSSHGTKAAQSS